jgi:hypothetical protein
MPDLDNRKHLMQELADLERDHPEASASLTENILNGRGTPEERAAEQRYEAAWKQLRAAVLAQAPGTFSFQHGGHYQPAEALAEQLSKQFPDGHRKITRWESGKFLPLCPTEDVEFIAQAVERGETAAITIPFRLDTEQMGTTCPYCGAATAYAFDGRTFTATLCSIMDDPFYVYIETKGRIVFDDDIRDLVLSDWQNKENAICREISGSGERPTLLSRQRIGRLYAKLGMVYIYHGDACPSLYQLPSPGGRERYQLASNGYERDEHGLCKYDEPIRPEGKSHGQLTYKCCVCIIDSERLLELGGGLPTGRASIIDVPPGRYRVRIHNYERGWCADTSAKPRLYATIEQVA